MSHIETGRSFPKADLIEKFADALGVEYNDFFSNVSSKSRKQIIADITNLLDEADDLTLHKIHRLIFNVMY